jgi:DNA-binding transcriptional regulator YiaG
VDSNFSLPTSSPADAPTPATRHPSSQSKIGTHGFEPMTGEEMQTLMKRLKLKKRELSNLMGVSIRTVQRWTNDPRMEVPGSVACALRSFVLLASTSHDFHSVQKINFEEISQV